MTAERLVVALLAVPFVTAIVLSVVGAEVVADHRWFMAVWGALGLIVCGAWLRRRR